MCREERYFKARAALRNALEMNPYYGDAYRQLGEVYFAMGITTARSRTDFSR
jgi:tetratricopeptide (TPR) repeat protein